MLGHRRLLVLSIALALFLLGSTLFAQETTASLQGTVKDPSGAVIVKAEVEIASPAMIGTKKMDTDDAGKFRFANLPPGTYSLTVKMTGFATAKLESIALGVGRSPSLDVALEVGSATQTVEVSGVSVAIDVATSKVQTNISEDILANLPTQSRSFQSLIQLAPGARKEPLQGGYQINGASNSENAYLVEGQETASLQDGHSAANVPISFIQEVQIKSSGFEAEYGGALGGVVNVVTKRGGNDWHGDLSLYYAGSMFNAGPNASIIRNPQIAANANGAKRLDQPQENYQPKKDKYRDVNPGFSLGGYLVRNRLWFFGGAAPEFHPSQRTVNFSAASGAAGPATFNSTYNVYSMLSRLDFMATSKIRLYGSWSYGYSNASGVNCANPSAPAPCTSALPRADDVSGQFNQDSSTAPNNFNTGIGWVRPNVIYSVGADITLSPTIIATTRFGYFYQDSQDRGKFAGVRYWYRDSNYNYPTTTVPVLPTTQALDGTVVPPQFVAPSNWSNIGANDTTYFDKWKRFSFAQDLAFFKHGLGTHNFKIGYAMNHGTNDVLNGFNSADVYVAFNMPYAPTTGTGTDNCAAISAQNELRYGDAGGDESGCQGLWGTVNLRELSTKGKVGGWNHAFYVQDAWNPGKGLTLNLGVRMDKENLPTYQTGSNFKGISFGWGDKIAPRLGFAYDVGQKGKIKLLGSFGYFYDIMKYNLPRGSFGGDYWHDCVYALDTPNFYSIVPGHDSNNHYCPLGGGAVPAVGNYPGLRFIENLDYRAPSNDASQVGTLGASGLVDPNLKPMQQHEMVLGAEFALAKDLVLETRYSRKRLDRTIEDAGSVTPNGEIYYIVNPGFGVNTKVADCPGCPAKNQKAVRNYDGIEFRLTKRMADNWTASVSYTRSKLNGNYSGLTATDISDGGGARDGANADRAFDEAFMQYDTHGKPIDGPLATDRPNQVKGWVNYTLKWWKFNTNFGIVQQIASGVPLSSYVSVWGAPVFVEGRGNWVDVTRDAATGNWVKGAVSAKRGPSYSVTDFSASQEFHISKTNEAAKARIGVEVSNLLNQHSATFIDQNLIRTSYVSPAGCGTAGTNCSATMDAAAGFDYGVLMTKGFDYIAQGNTNGKILNSRYGQAFGWQDRRTVRFSLQVTF